MHIRRISMLLVAVLLQAGCVTFGGYPKDIGGPPAQPPVANFHGSPVVQISFVANADPGAEAAFVQDFNYYQLNPTLYEGQASPELATPEVAKSNMQAMFAKNVFYAMHLAKYLKIKSDGNYVVILNPVTLKHDAIAGYSLQPFEQRMPPFDVDISFGSYVHPNTQPSTISSVITTYGATLAPVVSMRVDPSFSPSTSGAIALTSSFERVAVEDDGKGAHANLIDHINAHKYNAKVANYSAHRKESGPYERGKYYALPFKSFDLAQQVDPAVVSSALLREAGYNPGKFDAYEFYEAYYKIVMAALQVIDNRQGITRSQKDYYSYLESGDLDSIILKNADQRRRRFLLVAKETELRFLQDRDDSWTESLLKTNAFQANFDELRSEEFEARNQYVQAEAQAAAGAMLAILGAVASASGGSNNNAGLMMVGAAAAGAGVVIAVNAISKLGAIDSAFQIGFNASYDSQKSYVFEVSEGERDEVRAKDYKDFKQKLKEKYDSIFRGVVPGVS